MIKNITITNYVGDKMEYLIDGVQAENDSGLIITNIEGLGPVKANIIMSDLSTVDGSVFNSSRLEKRNIVISAEYTHAERIEDARLLTYKYFPIKKPLIFEVHTDNRDVKTVGYVESHEPVIFDEKCSVKISVLCESPYFERSNGDAIIPFAGSTPNFRFKYKNEASYPNKFKPYSLTESYDYIILQDVNGVSDVTGDPAGVTITVDKDDEDNVNFYKIHGLVPRSQSFSVELGTVDGLALNDWFMGLRSIDSIPANQTLVIRDKTSGGVYATSNVNNYARPSQVVVSPDNTHIYAIQYNITANYGDSIVDTTIIQPSVCQYKEGVYSYTKYGKAASPKSTIFGILKRERDSVYTNIGDVETGVTIEITFKGQVVNPAIINVTNDQRMTISGTFDIGTTLEICTILGKRYARTYGNGGIVRNAFNSLGRYPQWITLVKGDNIIGYAADSGSKNMRISIKVPILYEGV